MTYSILAMIVMLGSLIFVHELGHFLVGKYFGIAVEIFSIGFGPKIASWNSKGTDYQLCLLPLGGFVKFSGAFPGEQVKEGLVGKPFGASSRFARFMTVLAGPAANILFAVAIYSVIAFSGVEKIPASIGKVMPDSPAAKGGLLASDEILSIDGRPVDSWSDMNKVVMKSSGKTLNLEIQRFEGLSKTKSIKNIQVSPRSVEGEDLLGRKMTRGQLGISVGIVPAILTVRKERLGYEAGFVTGDKVLQVGLEGQEKFKINSYPHLMQILSDNSFRGNTPVYFDIETLTSEKKTVKLASSLSFEELGISSSVLTVRKIIDEASNIEVPLMFGDTLLEVDGQKVADLYSLQTALEKNTKEQVEVVFVREGKTQVANVKLKPVDIQRPEGKATIYTLPVELLGAYEMPKLVVDRYPYGFDSLWYGMKTTALQTGLIIYTFSQLLIGQLPIKSLGGPILIAKVAGDTAKLGWKAFVSAMALISINLAVVNLFPIPALDGGQIVLIGIEGIRRKSISIRAFENYQKVGFVFILALVVLAFSNDLSRFWGDIISAVAGGSK